MHQSIIRLQAILPLSSSYNFDDQYCSHEVKAVLSKYNLQELQAAFTFQHVKPAYAENGFSKITMKCSEDAPMIG